VAGNGSKRKFDDDEEDDESSTDEEEDDDAELADEEVDEEIENVLQAIRNKDPRIKDPNVKFFKDYNPEESVKGVKKEGKPMTLHDYQRERLLAGDAGDNDEEDEPVQTYQQEQDEMRRKLVGQMHATATADAESAAGDDDDEEDGMLVRKKKSKYEDLPTASTQAVKKKKKVKITEQDINEADKDPENYLSNFMAARAWLPTDGSRFQPLESDDSDDEKKADEYEHLYNLRHEDPTANEKLKSFSRDVGKYGVRRDEKTGRAKQREREKEMKEAEKRERNEEKARLRKLKVEEAEEKVKRIKEAAGLRGKTLDLDEWRDVIEGDFDDDKWEQEMKRRFGEDYYAEDDAVTADEEDEEAGTSKTRKLKKPTFDDDIDINDIIPDFDAANRPNITLTDDEDEDEDDGGAPLPPACDDEVSSAEEISGEGKKRKTKKDRLQEKSDAKRAARKERAKIEAIVDAALPLDHPTLTSAASHKTPDVGFRYRETSPTSFGLSARDILFADDTALNAYAGLKKMAAFRDQEKKQRDKKRYGKKQRLKMWRKDTFGTADEPTGGFERILGGMREQPVSTGSNHVSLGGEVVVDGNGNGEEGGNVKEGARKKKRSRKGKGPAAAAAAAA
jgi:protein KRI1